MKMRRVVAVYAAFALTILSPGGLFAQDLAAMCENFTAPADGHWAEYSAEANGREGRIRFAILSSDDAGGRLLEMTVSEVGGQSMIMQVNVPSYPFETSDITRVVMKAPGQPAMVLPTHMAQMSDFALPVPSDEDCLQAEFLGMESIDVGGTTYETFHIRPADQRQTEAWVTTEIPFAIITETPITIPGM
jgi:hypothetical protein